MEKVCLDCNSILKGRSDKKFCSDYCRNNYNNRRNSRANNYTRRIDLALRRNRRILQELFAQNELKVTRFTLLEKGFVFGYFTHQQAGPGPQTQYYCYEYGYRSLKNNQYILSKSSDSRHISLHDEQD